MSQTNIILLFKCIRGITHYVLYKFTTYLLTYFKLDIVSAISYTVAIRIRRTGMQSSVHVITV